MRSRVLAIIVVCSQARHFTLTMPLSGIQLAEEMSPSQPEGVCRFMLQKA